ncbi:MAG: membrane protein insertase YidC [Propionibacteriaceae bacterium]|jgi:YidC/Oxa1 family membrane protein insertase|nr:membrane protein insertase YidC [Propionibacteriaceae bacterium]
MMGFLDTILAPFYWLVSGLMVLLHNGVSLIFDKNSGVTWVLVIILMTVVVRGASLPLYVKQVKSMRATTAIQGELTAIRQKYKDDRDRQSRETMRLYEENGVSPYASCLPLIVQMPVFMGLFWVMSSIARAETIADVKGYWLQQRPDLMESLQNATLFGARFSSTFLPPSPFGVTQVLALVLIVVMTGVLFAQQLYSMQRNMPPSVLEGPMGKQQKWMMYLFPGMYAIGGVSIPIAVLFYWCCSNIWTGVQQYIMVRKYPTPNTPAYVDWEDRMIAKGLDPRELERDRLEKAREKNKGSLAAKAAQLQREQEEQAQAARKVSPNAETSTTVIRTNSSGQQVVVRQQPSRKARAKRKK